MPEGNAITLTGGARWPGPDYRGFETERFIYLVDASNALAVEDITNLLLDPKDQTDRIVRLLEGDAAIIINKETKTITKSKNF